MTKTSEGFAKLKGYDSEFFIQKLSVVLGRSLKKKKLAVAAATKQAQDSKDKDAVAVDIQVGDVKNVSRKHAIIAYNFQNKNYEMICLGKNGVTINGVFYGADEKRKLSLQHGAEIKMGDAFFVFLLPQTKVAAQKRKYTKRKNKKNKDAANEDDVAEDNAAATSNTPAVSEVATPSVPTEKKKKKTRPAMVYDEETKQVYEKPTQSYATMIAQALSAQATKQLSLQGIYQWIMDTYPYYQNADVGWRSSVRHNLSLNKFFRKVPIEETGDGKRAVYALNEEYEDYLLSGLTGRKLSKHIKEKEEKKGDPAQSATPTPSDDTSATPSKPKRTYNKRKKNNADGEPPAKRRKSAAQSNSEETTPVGTPVPQGIVPPSPQQQPNAMLLSTTIGGAVAPPQAQAMTNPQFQQQLRVLMQNMQAQHQQQLRQVPPAAPIVQLAQQQSLFPFAPVVPQQQPQPQQQFGQMFPGVFPQQQQQQHLPNFGQLQPPNNQHQ